MIVLASDHAGFDLKQKIKTWLQKNNIQYVDCGAETLNANDSYVDFAKKAIETYSQEYNQDAHKLILICGSGVGMSIVANRSSSIRAVLAYTTKQVMQARQHNNANCLCIGARNTGYLKAKQMIKTFLTTDFLGGKHLDRIKSI